MRDNGVSLFPNNSKSVLADHTIRNQYPRRQTHVYDDGSPTSQRRRSNIIAHRRGDVLFDRKPPQEVNPLLTHNALLTLRMCAHGQLPAFDFLVHLLLGLDNHITQKSVDSQKQSMNRNHGQRHINITRNAIGPKRGQKDCRKF